MPGPHITTLPPEVMQNIFGSLGPAEIVNRLPRVCSAFHCFIKGNKKLHQDVYLGWLVRCLVALLTSHWRNALAFANRNP